LSFIFRDVYENAKKALLEQSDMKGIKNIYNNKDYKPYFEICLHKCFIDNPKKKDTRKDYNKYYGPIEGKNDIDRFLSDLKYDLERCIELVKNEKDLHDYDLDENGLEFRIAQVEMAISKVITCQSVLGKEYECTKDEIIKYLKDRDDIIDKIKNERLVMKTVEYRRGMWD
jgi:hypothetical protein